MAHTHIHRRGDPRDDRAGQGTSQNVCNERSLAQRIRSAEHRSLASLVDDKVSREEHGVEDEGRRKALHEASVALDLDDVAED